MSRILPFPRILALTGVLLAVASSHAGEAGWRPSRCVPEAADIQAQAAVAGVQVQAEAPILVRTDALGADLLQVTYKIPAPQVAACASPYADMKPEQVVARPGAAVEAEAVKAPAAGLQAAQAATWHRCALAQAPRIGALGQPILPVLPVKLILPAGRVVDTVSVVPGRRVPLAGQWRIEPAQPPVPLVEGAQPTVVLPDPAIYEQDAAHPAQALGATQIQRKRGVNYLLANLVPVTYQGTSGTVSYYEELSLRVTLKAEERRAGDLPYRPSAVQRLEAGVENPETLNGYVAEPGASLRPKILAPLAPTAYQYLIVTSRAIRDANTVPSVRDLLAHRQARGLTGTILAMEDVLATYPGRDEAEQLRNAIIDAYVNCGIEYVLLGGDTGIVPMRLLYTIDPTAYIPSDLYFQCLDGSYNNDNDDQWGTPFDGVGGGEVDLMADVLIGRAPAENAEEMANLVAKTLAYETTPADAPALRNALMVGEYLGFGGVSQYATASMEQIRLGSNADGYVTTGFASLPSCSVETLYDSDAGRWAGGEIITRINSGRFSIINHLGHSNYTYVWRMYNPDADALTNDQCFFGYS